MKSLKKFLNKTLTLFGRKAKITQNREETAPPNREVKPSKLVMESLACPYCSSTDFQKRGFRQKKLERVQLYLCLSCKKTFTPHLTRGKHYPLAVMLDAVSIYNLGYSLEQTCRIVNERSSADLNRSCKRVPAAVLEKRERGVQPSTLSNWLSETAELCRFARMREYAMKKYLPKEMVIHATLAHRQLYRYRFHRAKCDLMIKEEYQHRKFLPLKEFLEMIPVECPHQYFQEGLRASEAPLTFSKTQMIVRAKQNYATKLATFVLQSVKERKGRHEALQKFMLVNDSVTVATEVPVYITRDDLEHLKTQLGFKIYTKNSNDKIQMTNQISNSKPNNPAAGINRDLSAKSLPKTSATTAEVGIADVASLPKLITGHIDFIQIRNGQIHILDYKPRAEKERPIEQLTLYAMALSRLTGLRLYEFKCAWFDEKDYFEFYPLHVLHKSRKTKRRRKVYTMEGIYSVNKDETKITNLRASMKF
ncbi:hypothetical protein M1523_01450 [Patescibacteria group bacterium]|nr:hypothetical protein [Patescibacteria group bacterium]MCL5091554.1 hypothetical protein [Patescibacteria group bacterium]